MSIEVCSFCNSQGEEDITYWQSEDGSACMCSECGLKYAKSTLDILNGYAEASDTEQGSSELINLCHSVADELMELGYLNPIIEDGNLTIITINVEGEEKLFKLNINLVVNDRQSSNLTKDEEQNVCNTFDTYLQITGLKDSFKALGFDLEKNFEGYFIHLV